MIVWVRVFKKCPETRLISPSLPNLRPLRGISEKICPVLIIGPFNGFLN